MTESFYTLAAAFCEGWAIEPLPPGAAVEFRWRLSNGNPATLEAMVRRETRHGWFVVTRSYTKMMLAEDARCLVAAFGQTARSEAGRRAAEAAYAELGMAIKNNGGAL